MPAGAVFADIDAGTGKITDHITKHGYNKFTVEPNDDMRAELVKTHAPYQNATIVNGTDENTTMHSENSVDVVTYAQMLNRVDINILIRTGMLYNKNT